jgi:hypothetical protein
MHGVNGELHTVLTHITFPRGAAVAVQSQAMLLAPYGWYIDIPFVGILKREIGRLIRLS